MQRMAGLFAAGITLLAYAAPAPGSAVSSAVALRAQAEAFAGRGVLLDPRTSVPECAVALALRWRDASGRALLAECPTTGWRLVLPVAGHSFQRQPATIRRGDPVTVRMAGPGFAIRLEAVAEGEGRAGGRVLVRNLRSGERVAAVVGADGQLWLAGQASPD